MLTAGTLLFGSFLTLGGAAIAGYGDIGCPGKRPARVWVGLAVAAVGAIFLLYVTFSDPH